jgi:hypothetical protein
MSEVAAPAGLRSGILISTPFDSDRVVICDTVQCCHCGRQWVYQKGSGRKRGFCLRCKGITCGNANCDACVPFEQQLENSEAGRPLHHRPIIASVPRSFAP